MVVATARLGSSPGSRRVCHHVRIPYNLASGTATSGEPGNIGRTKRGDQGEGDAEASTDAEGDADGDGEGEASSEGDTSVDSDGATELEAGDEGSGGGVGSGVNREGMPRTERTMMSTKMPTTVRIQGRASPSPRVGSEPR